MAREFILTVGQVELYDSDDNLVLTSETEISNSITQSVDTQEIRGGEFNQLFLEYSLTKNLATVLNDARFIQEYLAINNGTVFGVATANVYEENNNVVLNGSGVGTFSAEAIGDIYVIRANGSIQTITPDSATGGTTTFTVSGGADEHVDVRYRASKSVERIDIEANRFPGTFKLVITTGIFDSDNGQGRRIGSLQIIQPNWKIMGNMEMTFDASTPYQSSLEGKALSFRNEEGKDIYAEVIIDKTISSFATQIVGLFASPNTATLAANDTLQIQTIGDLGNGKLPIRNPAGVTFVSGNTNFATVDANGLITAVATGTTDITSSLLVGSVTYTDTVEITVS